MKTCLVVYCNLHPAQKGVNTMKKLTVVLLLVCLASVNSFAYGPRGHQLVGAIADKRLARNQALATKVRQLLDGITLQRAATFPDEIKGWTCGKTPSGPNRINRELQAFVNANCDRNEPSHNWFHYTNIPVLDRKSTRLNSSHSQISYAVFC